MTLAFLFPGPGSQPVGMGGALAGALAAAREGFDEGGDARGQALVMVRRAGPEDQAALTGNAQARRAALDSRTQYPAACNASETRLVHGAIAPAFLADAVPAVRDAGVTLRGDAASQALGVGVAASEEDWRTEYLDLVLAVRVAGSYTHLRAHGTGS